MIASYLVAAELTESTISLFGREASVRSGAPIWRWLRDRGSWHSVREIFDAFKGVEARNTYGLRRPYRDPDQVRNALTGSRALYDNGLVIINDLVSPHLYRAIGTDDDRDVN